MKTPQEIEGASYGKPMEQVENFVKHHIIRNSDTSLAGLVQLKRGKNLYT